MCECLLGCGYSVQWHWCIGMSAYLDYITVLCIGVHVWVVCVGITSSIEYRVGNYTHEERGYIATLGIGVQTSVAF